MSYSHHVDFSTDLSSYPHYLRNLIHTRVCEARLREAESGVAVDLSPPAGLPGSSPDTLGSSSCSLDETHPLLRDLDRCGDDLTAKILGALHSREELLLLARLQRAGPRRGHLFSETFEDDDAPCKDCRGGAWCTPEYSARRKVSDVASSGVVSLDEEDEEEADEDAEEGREQWASAILFQSDPPVSVWNVWFGMFVLDSAPRICIHMAVWCGLYIFLTAYQQSFLQRGGEEDVEFYLEVTPL